MRVYESTMCFVNCHFAAHLEAVGCRNADFDYVYRSIIFSRSSNFLNATINDVLFGIISYRVSRYLDLHSPKALKKGLQLTGVAMINLRKQSGLQDFSQLMDSKTRARWEGPCSYKIGDFVMSFFGPKLAVVLNYKFLSNTTFTFSNVIGPQEDSTFGGNHISSVKVTSSSLAHAITMHIVSYAGKADMQISVAKDIIPDPKVLAKCFQDDLLEMKEAAKTVAKSTLSPTLSHSPFLCFSPLNI
ncbi:hypothetical protein P3S68_008103 [Capsicum galapagoense]